MLSPESRVLIVDDDGTPANTPPEYVEHESLPNTVEPQFLGNLLASRQGATSVFGKLITDTDVDWYRFQVSYDDLIPTFATSRLEPDRSALCLTSTTRTLVRPSGHDPGRV